MSARALVLIAGNKQAAYGLRAAGLVLMAMTGLFAGGVLMMVYDNPYSMRGHSGAVYAIAMLGLAGFFAGLYLLLRRREVRFDPARGMVEDTRRFLGDESVERTPLDALDRVSLQARRRRKGGTTWSLAMRGPKDRAIPLGEGMQEHEDAVAAGLRAAAVTGLPLDEQDEEGNVVRLRAEQLAQLGAGEPSASDDTPWWRRPSALALIAANLVPLAGVLWWGWEVLPVMQLFWLENLIVGCYTMARMLRSSGSAALPLCVFFAVHYGGFCAVHGMILFAMFGPRDAALGMSALPGLVAGALSKPGLFLAALGLAISHGVSFVTNFLRNREYEGSDARKLMFQPYKRIVVLHLVVLLGGFMVQGLGAPLLPLVLLLGLKIAIDLGAHLVEHRAPVLREYKALAESAGVAVVPPVKVEARSERTDINDRPLAHYLGRWRLASGENAPPGWFSEIFFEEAKGRIGVRLVSQPGGPAGETLQSSTVRGDAARIEWIEVRLRAPGRERILRFTAAGTGGERIELHEVQQPEGNPKAMQARSFSLVR